MNSRSYVHKLGLNLWSGKGRMVHWEYFVSILSSILRTFVVKWNLLNFRNFVGLFRTKIIVDHRIWIWENYWKTIDVIGQFVKKQTFNGDGQWVTNHWKPIVSNGAPPNKLPMHRLKKKNDHHSSSKEGSKKVWDSMASLFGLFLYVNSAWTRFLYTPCSL